MQVFTPIVRHVRHALTVRTWHLRDTSVSRLSCLSLQSRITRLYWFHVTQLQKKQILHNKEVLLSIESLLWTVCPNLAVSGDYFHLHARPLCRLANCSPHPCLGWDALAGFSVLWMYPEHPHRRAGNGSQQQQVTSQVIRSESAAHVFHTRRDPSFCVTASSAERRGERTLLKTDQCCLQVTSAAFSSLLMRFLKHLKYSNANLLCVNRLHH